MLWAGLAASALGGLFGNRNKKKVQREQRSQSEAINAASTQAINSANTATAQAKQDSQMRLSIADTSNGANAVIGNAFSTDALDQRTLGVTKPQDEIAPPGSPSIANTTMAPVEPSPVELQPTYAGSGNWFDASFGGPQSGPSANSGG